MSIERRIKAMEALFGTDDGDMKEIEAYRGQLLSEARAMGGPTYGNKTYGNKRWIEWWRQQLTPQRIQEIMALRQSIENEMTEEENSE